jgi:hypothetical protein
MGESMGRIKVIIEQIKNYLKVQDRRCFEIHKLVEENKQKHLVATYLTMMNKL